MQRDGQDVMNWHMPIPRALDQSKCALFDDFPYISIQEKVLKAQASGQAHQELIRSLYSQSEYDVNDPEEMSNELDDSENGADAISAYRSFLSRRLARDKALADYRNLQHKLKQSKQQPVNQQVEQFNNQPQDPMK